MLSKYLLQNFALGKLKSLGEHILKFLPWYLWAPPLLPNSEEWGVSYCPASALWIPYPPHPRDPSINHLFFLEPPFSTDIPPVPCLPPTLNIETNTQLSPKWESKQTFSWAPNAFLVSSLEGKATLLSVSFISFLPYVLTSDATCSEKAEPEPIFTSH